MKIEINKTTLKIRTDEAIPAQVYIKDGAYFMCVMDDSGYKHMAVLSDQCVGPGKFNESRTGYEHVPGAKLTV